MEKPGKHNTENIIVSSIATAIGLILVLTKIYSYIGIILLSFGSLILLHFETYIALGIVLLVTAGARVAGEYYYGKISKNVGF